MAQFCMEITKLKNLWGTFSSLRILKFGMLKRLCDTNNGSRLKLRNFKAKKDLNNYIVELIGSISSKKLKYSKKRGATTNEKEKRIWQICSELNLPSSWPALMEHTNKPTNIKQIKARNKYIVAYTLILPSMKNPWRKGFITTPMVPQKKKFVPQKQQNTRPTFVSCYLVKNSFCLVLMIKHVIGFIIVHKCHEKY